MICLLLEMNINLLARWIALDPGYMGPGSQHKGQSSASPIECGAFGGMCGYREDGTRLLGSRKLARDLEVDKESCIGT